MISEKLAREFQKMGETMAVAEIASEIKRGFRGIAVMILACTLLLGSTACFIASRFAGEENKINLNLFAFIMGFIVCELLFQYIKRVYSEDKNNKSEVISMEIEVKEPQDSKSITVESKEKGE